MSKGEVATLRCWLHELRDGPFAAWLHCELQVACLVCDHVLLCCVEALDQPHQPRHQTYVAVDGQDLSLAAGVEG